MGAEHLARVPLHLRRARSRAGRRAARAALQGDHAGKPTTGVDANASGTRGVVGPRTMAHPGTHPREQIVERVVEERRPLTTTISAQSRKRSANPRSPKPRASSIISPERRPLLQRPDHRGEVAHHGDTGRARPPISG